MAEFAITLDTAKRQVVPATIKGRVGDAESAIIKATITANGVPYNFNGKKVRFECVKPNGSDVRDPEVTVSASTVSYKIPAEVLGADGIIKIAYFRIYEGTAFVDSTESFLIDVKRGISGDIPGSYIPELDAVVAAMAQQITGAGDAESARVKAESSRVSAESTRVSKETARQSAESSRATKETARQTAESARAVAESSRAGSEAARVGAETGRVTAEVSREDAEAKRVADFAEMEQRSKGWLRYYCAENEYDTVTRKPIIAEPDTATLYFVPVEVPTAENEWYEWMWDSRDGDWERLGTTESTVTPISTDQIDAIISDEQQTGSEVLNRSGLSYLWAKLKAAFAPLSHKHGGADINDNSITSAKLVDGTIVNADVSVNAGIAGSKLAAASVPRSKIDATFEQDIADLETAWDSVSQAFGTTAAAQVIHLSDSFTANTIVGARYGRIAMIILNVKTTREISGQVIIGTLTDDFVPYTTAGLTRQVAHNYAGFLASGAKTATIDCGSTLPAGTNIYLLGTYITKQ